MYLFLNGVAATGSLFAGLLFLRLGSRTNDRFFTWFALAFWLLALERVILSLLNAPESSSPAVYLVRLAAFFCIIYAVVSKNLWGRR